MPLGYLRELAGYCADGYDWQAWEAKLNEHPQVIGPLADPRAHGGEAADAFVRGRSLASRVRALRPDVRAGWDVARITRAFAELMDRGRSSPGSSAGPVPTGSPACT